MLLPTNGSKVKGRKEIISWCDLYFVLAPRDVAGPCGEIQLSRQPDTLKYVRTSKTFLGMPSCWRVFAIISTIKVHANHLCADGAGGYGRLRRPTFPIARLSHPLLVPPSRPEPRWAGGFTDRLAQWKLDHLVGLWYSRPDRRITTLAMRMILLITSWGVINVSRKICWLFSHRRWPKL